MTTVIPPPPLENDDPWFEPRDAFDQAVRTRLNDELSDAVLGSRFADKATQSTVETGRLSEAELSATIGSEFAEHAPAVIADQLADNPSIVDAAAERALNTQGVVTAAGEGDLIIRAEDKTRTWMQSRDEVDEISGISLPTDEAMYGLGRGGSVLLVPENMPSDLNLVVGEARIYLNDDGEPVLVIES